MLFSKNSCKNEEIFDGLEGFVPNMFNNVQSCSCRLLGPLMNDVLLKGGGRECLSLHDNFFEDKEGLKIQVFCDRHFISITNHS